MSMRSSGLAAAFGRITLGHVVAAILAVMVASSTSEVFGMGPGEVSPALVKCHSPDGGLCSGVVVDPSGVVLTAKHCGADDTIEVVLHGTQERLQAVKIMEDGPPEGAVAYRLPAGKYDFYPVGSGPPKTGDEVYSIGYPSGQFAYGSGTVIRDSLASTSWAEGLFFQNITDLTASPGWSGGPLFNSNGGVIGLCSNGGEGYTAFVSYGSIVRTYYQAITQGSKVVVFTLPDKQCGPCDRLKKAIDDGQFPGYSFQVVTYRDGVGFDDEELAAAFSQECPSAAGKGFPIIWVPGSGPNGYQAGYQSRRPVMAFLERVANLVIHGPQPKFRPGGIQPQPDPVSIDTEAIQENAKRAAAEMVKTLETELQELREHLGNARGEIETLRAEDAGILEKIQAVSALRNEAKAGKESVIAIREAASPLSVLGLLGGIVTGIVRRRWGVA
ncbi:S1 family peptidase [Thalassoglobus polymorphus]|nr:serine protease [Thalassoglobus polymorphus]